MRVIDRRIGRVYGLEDYSHLFAQFEVNLDASKMSLIDIFDASGLALHATVLKREGFTNFKVRKDYLGASFRKLVARTDGADGVSWVDNFVYQDGVQTIEFTSQGAASGGGDQKAFSGSVALAGEPVAREVYALAVDGDQPQLLAKASSAADGNYQLTWQGYTGKIMVVAADDYGRAFTAGAVLNVGDRIHPGIPNGYVYEVSGAGALGSTEPTWPAESAAVIISGEVQLTAKPFYRPKAAGPFIVN